MRKVREGPGGGSGPHRILVVDDEAAVRAGVEGILVEAGYRVACRASAREAKEALHHHHYDLVLTDLYLADRALGFEIVEVARRCHPPVPTILLTGRPSLDGAQEAIRSQVTELVVKPVDAMTLISSCRRAIQAAELEQRQRRLVAQNQVLARVLPRAIEAKDPTTCGHAERVVRYTDVLAQRCGVSLEERQDLRMASLLHDVGKIGIPEKILTKPGQLTTEEREVIQRHPQMGFDILEPLTEGDQIRRWVVQHHERWDGHGYPEGLAGADVDLPGRILILAEVYDALAEPRSYKPAWPMEKIVGFFQAEAGKHFDPTLARLVADGLTRLGTRFFSTEPGMLF
jgi:putative two-component system response regulator